MVFETEKFEIVLLECIESRNVHQFQYILDELRMNPNKKLKCFDGLSTFEKVLITPNSRRFIEICIHNGSDFYKKNADGIYPLHYAIYSFCLDNLEAILKPMDEAFAPLCDDHLVATQYTKIINEKFDGGNNYLHLLITHITEENYEDISSMIKVMLVNGCNINSPNELFQTPFYLMLKSTIVENNLINFLIDNTRIDYYSYNSNDVIRLMEERNLLPRMSKKMESFVDANYIAAYLEEWDDLKFISNLEVLQKNSQDFRNDIMQLVEEAVVKNLPESIGILLALEVDINEISQKSKFKMAPAFVACTLGYHHVLKVLLNDQNLSFQSNKSHRNLLHQLFSSEGVDAHDRQKSFDLIISDKRCTLDIINQEDDEGLVPLSYACQYGSNEIVKELLRRGAYIGNESILDYINKDTLEEFLDECVKCSSSINDRNCEIYFDYKFLVPPNNAKLEIHSAHLISTNSNLKEFILHPVIASFVFLKWKRIDFIVYFNLIVYFSFMLFLGLIIIDFYDVTNDFEFDNKYCVMATKYHDELFDVKLSEYIFVAKSSNVSKNSFTHLLYENLNLINRLYNKTDFDYRQKFIQWENVQKNEEWKTRYRQHFTDHSLSHELRIFGLLLMAAYEVVQFSMSWKKYFFKPMNWLDILLIGFSFFVLVKDIGRDSFKEISAVMILLMGAQSINLFSKVSAFSLSLHMAILNKVCRTFLKTIAPYLIIISAFGMSFFVLNIDDYYEASVNVTSGEEEEEEEGFADPFLSTISTVRMMLSDFEAMSLKEGDHFQGILFLAFMISISIVLFNLLNALAITDTYEMMEVAELVETKMRISTLLNYETLFSFCQATYSNVFPNLTTIMLTPNEHRYIKIKQKIQMSDNITILMQKIGEVSRFEYLYTDWMFWKSYPEPISFDRKFMKKILNFVKKQQENKLCEIDKNRIDQELKKLRLVHEDNYKELQEMKMFKEIRESKIDEILQGICRELRDIKRSQENVVSTINELQSHFNTSIPRNKKLVIKKIDSKTN